MWWAIPKIILQVVARALKGPPGPVTTREQGAAGPITRVSVASSCSEMPSKAFRWALERNVYKGGHGFADGARRKVLAISEEADAKCTALLSRLAVLEPLTLALSKQSSSTLAVSGNDCIPCRADQGMVSIVHFPDQLVDSRSGSCQYLLVWRCESSVSHPPSSDFSRNSSAEICALREAQ